MLFRHLSEAEEKEFREAARKNYKVFDPINGVWHPVYQDECAKMNAETGYSPRGIHVALGEDA